MYIVNFPIIFKFGYKKKTESWGNGENAYPCIIARII